MTLGEVIDQVVELRDRVKALEAPSGTRVTVDFRERSVSLMMQTPRSPIPHEVAGGSDIEADGIYLMTGEGRQFIVVAADADGVRAVLDKNFPKS